MSEAATIAAPPATTEATPAETKPSGQGTADVKPGAQQDPVATTAAAAPADPPAPSDPSPTEAAIAASRKADANRMATLLGIEGDFDSIDAVEEAQAEVEAQAREDALATQENNKYGDRVRNLIGKAKGLKIATFDADGEPTEIALTDAHIQPLVDELNGLRQDIGAIQRQESYDVLASAVLDILPESAHEAFGKAVEKGLSIDQWFQAAAEAIAPHTKWAKQNALDKDAADKAGYDRGFAEGAGAPKGQVSQANSTSKPPVTGDGKTVPERAALLAAGELDFGAEMRRVLGRM